MNILFPSSPLTPKSVDRHFVDEAQAAKAAGFGISRVDLEIILGGEVKLANIPDEEPILYRGWLMKPEHYLRIDEALGGRLVTRPEHYNIAYNLPEWLKLFPAGATPRTLVLQGQTFDLDEVAAKVLEAFQTSLSEAQQAEVRAYHASFKDSGGNPVHHTGHLRSELMEVPGPRPVMVKDYLKSAKHRWFDCCYMPDCRDLENVKRVTKNFLDNQAENLTGGLCFREFVHCRQLTTHSKTGIPVVNEWRAFLRYGKVIYLVPYWAEGDYQRVQKPLIYDVETMCRGLNGLPFVAIDIGELDAGEWVAFEVNDGGGSGVPDGGSATDFYQALAKEFIQ